MRLLCKVFWGCRAVGFRRELLVLFLMRTSSVVFPMVCRLLALLGLNVNSAKVIYGTCFLSYPLELGFPFYFPAAHSALVPDLP